MRLLKFTNIQHEWRRSQGLSCTEYVLCDMIYHLSRSESSQVPNWCYMSRNVMAEEIGITKQGLIKMLERLIEKGLIIKNQVTKHLKTTEEWQQVYFTDGKQSLPEGGKESLPTPSKQSLPNNKKTNKESLDKEKLPELSVERFSQGVHNCLAKCYLYFPQHLWPKSEEKWLHTIDKLHRIEKLPYETIVEITKLARQDSFWSKNFLSIQKLRKKNSEGVMYVVVFGERFLKKQQTSKFESLVKDAVELGNEAINELKAER